MRPIPLLTLAAVLALAACKDEAPASEGALSNADVEGISDNAGTLQPGEYATREELVELDAPGADEAAVTAMRAAFTEGAAEPHLYCVTEEMTREQWLSAMTGANCTLSRLDAEGASLDGAMVCNAEEGLNGTVEFTGTVNDTASNVTMTYATPLQAGGEATARFTVSSERTGEACS